MSEPVSYEDGGVLGTAFFVAFFAGFWGLPLGLVLIPTVHFLCRDSESQLVHVAVAGLAGVLGCTVAILVLFGPDSDGWGVRNSLLGGFATATARGLVIPFVGWRQQAQTRLRAANSAAVPSPSSAAR